MKLTVAARMAKARAARVYTAEQQTPWCGLAYVHAHGLPGYPPPVTALSSISSPEQVVHDLFPYDTESL